MAALVAGALSLASWVADAALKGAVLLLVAGALALALRHRSAASRHAVWVFALVAQGLLVLGALYMAIGHDAPGWVAGIRAADRTGQLLAACGVVAVLGGVGIAVRGLAAMLAVRGVMQRGRRLRDGAWLEQAHRVGDELRITRPLIVVTTPDLEMPATTGIIYPRILLPASADAWGGARRRIVLLHELAHVSRFDAATHLLVQVTTALAWWNPLVWLAARRVRTERERACDDAVLRQGVSPSTYAANLLQLVRELRAGAGTLAPSTVALSMASAGDIESRLAAVLDDRMDRAPLARRALWSGGALSALVALPLATWSPVLRHAATSPGMPVAESLTVTVSLPPTWGGFPPCSPREAGRASSTSSFDKDDSKGQLFEVLYAERSRGRCLQAHLSGTLALDADEREVTSLAGVRGEVRLREVLRSVRREVVVRPAADGGLVMEAWRNGHSDELTADVRAWFGTGLAEVMPRLGLRTRERVSVWYAAGGIDTVLARIARIGSVSHEQLHLSALLDVDSLDEVARLHVLEAAVRRLAADESSLHAFLTALPPAVVRSDRFDPAVDALVARVSSLARAEVRERVLRDRHLARGPRQ